MLFACSKGDMCPYNGWTNTPFGLCDKCDEKRREQEKREEEKYERLMQKDSRVKRRKKGWKK